VNVAPALDRYYTALDAGDVEATTAAFADDAFYIRPSLEVTGTLEIASGREELHAYFVARGKKPFRHDLRACAVDGPDVFVEGVATQDGKELNSFLAHAVIGEDGLIRRYFALMAAAPGPTAA
jgi:ketosteroid isomerase-like protein